MLSPLRLEIDPLADGSPSWLIDEDYVKAQLRVDFGDDDDFLQLAVRGAIIWAENASHRTIWRRGHKLVLDCFPETAYQSIWLPRGRTISVERIRYSSNGSLLTLTGPSSIPPGTAYQEDLRGDLGAILMPPRGGVWPPTDYDVPAPVTIEYTAGWLTTELPPDLMQAILLAISDSYDLRGSADFLVAGNSSATLAKAGETLAVRETMISPYRMSRWF